MPSIPADSNWPTRIRPATPASGKQDECRTGQGQKGDDQGDHLPGHRTKLYVDRE